MVAAQDSDDVAGGHASFLKPACQGIGTSIHLVVSGRAIVVDDGGGIRLTNGECDESHGWRTPPALRGSDDA